MGTNIEWLGYPAHPIQGDIEVFLINHVHVMLTKETRDEWKPDGSLDGSPNICTPTNQHVETF